MNRTRGVWILLALLSGCVEAQGPSVHVPDGPRHFIVLVDAGSSTQARRPNLRTAEDEVTSLVYDTHHLAFHPHRDIVSILDFGLDRTRHPVLPGDYIHTAALHSGKLTREAFHRKLKPPYYKNLGVAAWAVPLGLAAAAIKDGRHIQHTYLVCLKDTQSSAVPANLPAGAQRTLKSDQRQLAQLIQRPIYKKTFGDVDVSVCDLSPPIPPLSNTSPITNPTLGWSGGRLQANFDVPQAFRGTEATLNLGGAGSRAFMLADHNTVALNRAPSYVGGEHPLILSLKLLAPNPLLGTQVVDADFAQPIVVPNRPPTLKAKLARALVELLLLAAALGAGIWFLFERFVARRVLLWLPDYAAPFSLPPIGKGGELQLLSRAGGSNGETAIHCQLPAKWVRKLVYKNAALKWGPELSVQGFHDQAPLEVLPGFVDLFWTGREPLGGAFDLSIEQSGRGSRHYRVHAKVRYNALPASKRIPLQER